MPCFFINSVRASWVAVGGLSVFACARLWSSITAVASYEMRKMVVLREIERRNDRLSRQLQKASSEVLDAEFSEAAE